VSIAARYGILVAVLAIVVAMLVPYPSLVVPPWRLQVVDPDGRPMPAIKVRQHWQNYSFESEGHEIDARTDAAGWVAFPARAASKSALFRIIVPVGNGVLGGVHASFGPSSMIQAWNNEYEGWVHYKAQGQLPDRLVLSKRQLPELR